VCHLDSNKKVIMAMQQSANALLFKSRDHKYQARGRYFAKLAAWIVGPLSNLPGTLNAQSVQSPPSRPPSIAPSQVTPGANRQAPLVIPSSAATRLDVAVPPLDAPLGAEALQIFLQNLIVSGSFPDLDPALAAFHRDVVGHSSSLAEVYAAASRLEAAYAEAGYVLVRITIPPQRIEQGGTLQVNVIDGTIEAIDDEGLPDRVRGFVRDRLDPLVGRPQLRLAEIERRLTLAGSAAGLTLRSALRTGGHPGTTRLAVDGHVDDVALDFSWDNSLPSALGSHMLTASALLNDLAGFGEQVALSTGQTAHVRQIGSMSSPYGMESLAVNLPLGSDGLSLSASRLQSRTVQTSGNGFLDALGHFARTSAAINDALVARHEASLSLSLSEDIVVQSNALPYFGLTLNSDHYTSLRLGLGGWIRLAGGGYVSGELHFARGLTGRTRITANDIPLSQAGAAAHYAKLGAGVSWQADINQNTAITITGNAQSSFGAALFVPEKLALSGADSVSATVPGQLIADSGLSLRGELARLVTFQGTPEPGVFRPYLFSATAFGWQLQPGATPHGYHVQSLGTGMRWNTIIRRSPVNVRLEYGRCFCAAAVGQDDNRVNLMAGISF